MCRQLLRMGLAHCFQLAVVLLLCDGGERQQRGRRRRWRRLAVWRPGHEGAARVRGPVPAAMGLRRGRQQRGLNRVQGRIMPVRALDSGWRCLHDQDTDCADDGNRHAAD